jgi:hypothetical protein
VSGGGVQEVASDTPDVLIKLLDMDAIEEGEPPDEWRPPDLVIHDRERFEAYTSGEQTPLASPSSLSPHLTRARGFFASHMVSNHHTDSEPGSSMSIIHDFHDIYSLDCLISAAYIIYQAVG